MKKVLYIFLACIISVSIKAQTYNPSLHTVTSKALGISQANSTDARTMFYDATNFVYRPYVSTSEVISYLNLAKYRVGGFDILINSGGTLTGGGVIIGGTNTIWYFKDSTGNGNLVQKIFGASTTDSSIFATHYDVDTAKVNLRISIAGKLSTTLSSGQILVGNGSNVATPVTPSNDVTVTSGGSFTVKNQWRLIGNSGTADLSNFIGTTDNVPLSFKVNNFFSGRIDNTNANAFFGYRSGGAVSSANNTAIGHAAMLANSSGGGNAALGTQSLFSNTFGNQNTAIGYNALSNNTTGANNTVIGANTGLGLVTGSYNTIVGSGVGSLAAALNNNIILSDGQGNIRFQIDSFATAIINSTTALGLPSGTTAQRPSSAIAGYTRWNTDSTAKETFNGSIWVKDGSGGGGGGSGTVTSVGAVIGTSGTDFNIGGTSPITTAGTFTFNLPIASSTNTGKLSNTDWSTFNGKQPAGSYITALTGDVAANGPGSAVATIQANAVTTTKINNNAVTLAKEATGTANSLRGYDGSGNAAVVTLTTTGSSGPATISGAVLNIPQYSGGSSGGIQPLVVGYPDSLINQLSIGRGDTFPNNHIKTYIGYGNSVTAAFGLVNICDGYFFRVAAAVGMQQVDRGISGTTLVQLSGEDNSMQARLPGVEHYDSSVNGLFSLMYGLNDGIHGVSTGTFITEYEVIIDTLLARGWPANRIIIYSPTLADTSVYTTVPSFVAACQTVATATGVFFFDSYHYMLSHGAYGLLQADGLHPNNFGAATLARGITTTSPIAFLAVGGNIRTKTATIENNLVANNNSVFNGNIYTNGNVVTNLNLNQDLTVAGGTGIAEQKWRIFKNGATVYGFGISHATGGYTLDFFGAAQGDGTGGVSFGLMGTDGTTYTPTYKAISDTNVEMNNFFSVYGKTYLRDFKFSGNTSTLDQQQLIIGNYATNKKFGLGVAGGHGNFFLDLYGNDGGGGVSLGTMAQSDGTTYAETMYTTTNLTRIQGELVTRDSLGIGIVPTSTNGTDSIAAIHNGILYGVLRSSLGGNLSNLGSAYRAAVAGTSNVKTFSASRYLKWDSATTGQLNVSLDTTTLFAALADTVTIRNLGSGQVQAYGLSKVLGIATINGLNSISATTGTDSAINVKLLNDTAIGTAASYYYGTSTGGSAGRRGFYPLPASGVTTVAFGSTPNSNGASISGTTLTIQPANGSNPGGVSTAAQVFGGSKEISGQLLADGGTNSGTSHITIQGNLTGSAQGPGGNGLFVNSYTYTDNSSSTGSVATSQPVNTIFQTTLAASNTGVVYTGDVATLKIAGAPIAGTNVTINNPYALYVSAGNSFFGGNVSMRHLIGNSSTPGIAAGTGAGSSPTIGITGSDLSGTITLTSGTLPTLSATVATVTYNAAYGSQPRVVLTPVNSNAALLSGVTMVYINDASSSASSFVLTAGTTALSAATIYVWYYQVVQ